MSKDKETLSVVSLFSGLGGLDLGFLWEGYEIVWANDLSQDAVASYQTNFGTHAVQGDLLEIPLSELPPADVVIGGPPCQSFSLVGKRLPEDPRGQLVFRFLDVVRHLDPKGFVMENVPGMAASMVNGERLTDYLVEQFRNLGYQVTLMTLVATDYLVPQRRKRLVIVGCKNGKPETPDPFKFAKECYRIDLKTYDLSAKAAIGDLGACTVRGQRAGYHESEPSAFARLMRSHGGSDVSLHECPKMSATDTMLISYIPPGGNYRDVPDSVATGRIMKFKQTGGRTTTYGRLHPDHPSYTINTYFRRPNVGCNFHYSEPRLITPREAMRFQSFPDHFEISYTSQDARNSLIGNAVPPLMARAVAWSLKQAIYQEPKIGPTYQISMF